MKKLISLLMAGAAVGVLVWLVKTLFHCNPMVEDFEE
jgi:hypothetical protein